jgi:hypothetical protein
MAIIKTLSMKKYFPLVFFLYLVTFYSPYASMAQDSTNLKIANPYDSLLLSDVKAVGNSTNEALKISMKFKNISSKHQTVHLSLGGFEDFGIISMQGKRYKVYTSESLIGTSQINKGYHPISTVQFGNKKLDWVTSIIQELNPGEEQSFTIQIAKFDKADNVIKNVHVRCILTVNYMHAGDNKYIIENIPIEWMAGNPKTK